jgi:ribosomal protein S18 acetylase RimI-like enzyme
MIDFMACAAPGHYHLSMNEQTVMPLRTATADDVPAIVALVQSAYRGESGLRGWTTESHLLDGQRTDAEDVSDVMGRPDSRVLLAETDGRLQATCHVDREGESAYFGMFAVDPSGQGQGLGKQMLAEAERIARDEWRCRFMRMTVIEQRDELIAWYQRRGYRRSGEFKPFPYGDERFGIPRRDDLRFEVLIKMLGESSS